MHEPRKYIFLGKFNFGVLLLALALTAGTAQAAPQAATPAITPSTVAPPAAVHPAIIHQSVVHRFARRRTIIRRVIVQRVVVQRVVVQPSYARPTAAPKKVVASAPAKAIVVSKPPASATYKPPASATYKPPASATYKPPASATYKPPASATYKPPASATYKPAASVATVPAQVVAGTAPAQVVVATAPDYGGRDSAPLTTVGDAAPNPAAQAGRALEALVVVLAGVAGIIYLLKRFHLVQPGTNGKPARISSPAFGRLPRADDTAVAVLSSQTLPGGTMLHVVRVEGKNLLLAATAQSVTTVTEWGVSEAEVGGMADDFEEYLSRANPNTPNFGSGIAAANARLRSLLSSQKPEEPS